MLRGLQVSRMCTAATALRPAQHDTACRTPGRASKVSPRCEHFAGLGRRIRDGRVRWRGFGGWMEQGVRRQGENARRVSPLRHPLLGHHHLDELLVVHLTVTVHISLADHLVNLLVRQLLAQVGHHVTQLAVQTTSQCPVSVAAKPPGGGAGSLYRTTPSTSTLSSSSFPFPNTTDVSLQYFMKWCWPQTLCVQPAGAVSRAMGGCWVVWCGKAHLRGGDVPVAVLVEHLERLLQLLLGIRVLARGEVAGRWSKARLP